MTARYYVRTAPDEPNSAHVYDRATPHPTNHTGHACVAPYLTHEQADELAAHLNDMTSCKTA